MHAFDPQTITEAGVAIGTLILAGFTGWLAHRTTQLSEEAREERKLTERALDASNRLASTAEQQLQAARDQVRASQQQAEATREALRASVQPMLVDVPLGLILEAPLDGDHRGCVRRSPHHLRGRSHRVPPARRGAGGRCA